MELKYYLYAIVVHTGFSSTSGHYYCFIRSGSDSWYRFDDSKVILPALAYVSQSAFCISYVGKSRFSLLHFRLHYVCVSPYDQSVELLLFLVYWCKLTAH